MTYNTFNLINQFSIEFFTIESNEIFFSCAEGYIRKDDDTDIEISFVLSGNNCVTSNVTYVFDLQTYINNNWADFTLKTIITDTEKLVAKWLLNLKSP